MHVSDMHMFEVSHSFLLFRRTTIKYFLFSQTIDPVSDQDSFKPFSSILPNSWTRLVTALLKLLPLRQETYLHKITTWILRLSTTTTLQKCQLERGTQPVILPCINIPHPRKAFQLPTQAPRTPRLPSCQALPEQYCSPSSFPWIQLSAFLPKQSTHDFPLRPLPGFYAREASSMVSRM